MWRAKLLTALGQASGLDKEERLREALSTAKSIESQADRANALAALAPQLHIPLLAEAKEAAREIQDAQSRVEALAALGQQFATLGQQLAEPEQESCLDTVLALVQEERDDWLRAPLLGRLAPILSRPLVSKALSAAKKIEPARVRVKELAALLPELSSAEQMDCLQEIVKVVIAEQTGRLWSRALWAVAPYLSGQLLTDVLAAQGFEDEAFCAGALAGLAHNLQGSEKESVLRDALAAVTRIANEWERAEKLTALAPQLSGSLVSEALPVARAIQDAAARLKALAALSLRLNGKVKEEVVAELAKATPAAMKIDSNLARAEVLAALAPHLSLELKDSVVRETVAATRGIEGPFRSQVDEVRAKLLATIAPYLNGPALQEALSVVRDMEFGRARAEALLALAGRMTPSEKETALCDELSQISARDDLNQNSAATEDEEDGEYRHYGNWLNSWDRAKALAGLAPQLREPLLTKALSLARQVDSKAAVAKAAALTALARQMTGSEKEVVAREALSAAKDIDRAEPRAVALAKLAPELGEPEKTSVLTDALAASKQCEGDEPLMESLVAISPRLSGPLLATALSAVRGIKDKRCRARAVDAIAQSARDRGELIDELRRYIVYHLWSELSSGGRGEVYEFCASEHLFHPPIVNTQVLKNLATQISEIGLRWQWT